MRITIKIPARYRQPMFYLLALSWLSGIVFFTLNTWVTVEGEFGPEKHPLQYPAIQVHAAAAFLIMICFGSLLASHVPSGWRTSRLRKLGLTLVGCFGFQIISAYLLYYLANDFARTYIGYLHAGVGFCLPLVLLTHILLGRRKSKEAGVKLAPAPTSKKAATDF